MSIPEYIEKINQLRADFSDEDRLRQRVDRMFPGIPVDLTYDKENGRLHIGGLSEQQMAELMTP